MSQPTLTVNEIFYSIQGEASHAGLPCIFVRLTACDLRCRWCDTEYAFHQGSPMTVSDIVTRVRKFGCLLVEVTGGEPLLQPQVTVLVQTLLDGCFALLGGRLRPWLASRARARLRNRMTGGLLIGAGLGLALARRS